MNTTIRKSLVVLIALFAVAAMRTNAIADKSGTKQPAKYNTLTEAELADGWILLFDGESDFGWAKGSDANWRIADGTISVSAGKPGLLHTTSEFADYVLRTDFRAPPETNSGIFLRTAAVPTSPTVRLLRSQYRRPCDQSVSHRKPRRSQERSASPNSTASGIRMKSARSAPASR